MINKLTPLGLVNRPSADLFFSFPATPTFTFYSTLSITIMANTPLQAVYTAPDATKSFQHAIPMTSVTASDPLAAKLAHLRALQSLVPKLQDEVNVYLTARMEEDKKAQGQASEKEAKEEENYGEEVVEDDA